MSGVSGGLGSPVDARYNPSEGWKLDPGHSGGCYLAEQERDEFIVHVGSRHDLRRNGSKGGSAMWQGFRCYCINCEAVLWVRWDVLMNFLMAGAS